MLTKKQKKFLDYIQEYFEKKGYSPSHDEIRKHFKLASVSTVNHYMKALQEKGYITREKSTARSTKINKQDIAINIPFKGYISAGLPIEAIEEHETTTVPKNMVASSGEHFALGVKGNSMIDEGIFDGDTVIIKKQNTVENGETAVALINGNEVTLKKIFKEKTRIRLQPANPALKPLFVKTVIIQGKVISVIRNLGEQDKKDNYLNKVYFKDARSMAELPDNSVHLIITSPPYFNIKDYSLDGYQRKKKAEKEKGQIGDISDYKKYIEEMLKIWQECERVLTPNGKLVINTPLMPILKKNLNTHHNRHIFDINSDIEHSILNNTKIFLLDVFIWNRTNPSKRLMFGSYPYPRNFYAQNSIEFITVYVKEGTPENNMPSDIKEKSKLTEKEWVEFTKQVWNIPVPNKGDLAFGEHSAIMPEEIVRRCVRLYTYTGEAVLDPFAGSGTTLKVAKELKRNYVGYEISRSYERVINLKLNSLL